MPSKCHIHFFNGVFRGTLLPVDRLYTCKYFLSSPRTTVLVLCRRIWSINDELKTNPKPSIWNWDVYRCGIVCVNGSVCVLLAQCVGDCLQINQCCFFRFRLQTNLSKHTFLHTNKHTNNKNQCIMLHTFLCRFFLIIIVIII